MRKGLRIARELVRIGVIRKSQFRLEFFNQVGMDVLFYLAHIATFEILYTYTETIAGWSLAEMRLFLGFLFISDAFMMVWLGQSWHFGEDLKKGNLDPFRVRPYTPIVLYFFQRFSLEGFANSLIALSYLAWALSQVDLAWWPACVTVPLAMAIAAWAQVVFVVMTSLWELYFLNSGLANFSAQVLGPFASRPLDIFGRRVRAFMTMLLPVGFLVWIPTRVVLGRVEPLHAVLYTVFTLLFGLAVFRFWRYSLHRYESAMS